MILALCTGYHPFGDFGERVAVQTVDGECHRLTVAMIPLRSTVLVTVRELVPYNSNVVDELCSNPDFQWTKLDFQNATVLLRDPHSRNSHKFIAVPVSQPQVLAVHDVISGKFFLLCCSMLLGVGCMDAWSCMAASVNSHAVNYDNHSMCLWTVVVDMQVLCSILDVPLWYDLPDFSGCF